MSAKKPKHADQWLQIYQEHPFHAKSWWVAVLVLIRKNSTGEVREYYSNHEILEGAATHPSTFIWTDGNYACDCNRHLFFTNHEGEDDCCCGEGAYSVNLVNPVTGEAYYKEFEQ